MSWTARQARAVAAVVPLDILVFVLVTSLPRFQAAHHHWIFPVLAAALAVQWLATFLVRASHPVLDPAALRAASLSALLFLIVMGIVRHATILACFDQCGFKLAAAAALAAPVFLAQSLLGEESWWSPLRARLAFMGAGLWSLYLVLRGFQLTAWTLDLLFVALALLLWLGRSRADCLVAALGAASGIVIRQTASEAAVILLGVVWSVALPLALAPRVEAWLAARRAAAVPPSRGRRLAYAAALTAGLGAYLIGPVFLTTDEAGRQARLLRLAPAFPVRDPGTLSPLAARLRAHVAALAKERSASDLREQERARDYVLAQLRRSGYAPKTLAYGSEFMPGVKHGTPFYNVEALLPAPRAAEAWVVGAHYDSAHGTAGADDNASGVAVLLETARLLKARRPAREIRFVAFGTEEPPAFGTRNMGSDHYARRLLDGGVRVHGMISLEMLGYYNTAEGSQLYPPFLHLFYPDRGDFLSVSANVKSRALLGEFLSAWRARSSFPLQGAVLPGALSSLALSDQLNFWNRGLPALMLSDTAFYRNPHYHESADAADTLDYERMAEATRALAAVLEAAP